MDRELLRRLEMLNQLSLTEEEKASVIGFFERRGADSEVLSGIETSEVERMVHVLPVMTVVREDVVSHPFSRDELQRGAPETDEGYWCVPRVIE